MKKLPPTPSAVALAFPGVLVLCSAAAASVQEYEVLRTMVPRDRQPGRDLVLADVDADGDADVFVAGLWGNALYRNDGHGVFERQTAGLPSGSASVAAGDVDGDDDLDLILGGFSPGGDFLLRNDGSGSFTTSALPPAANYAESAALLDVDGDGDLDAMLGDFDGVSLLRNDGGGGFTHDGPAVPAFNPFGCVFAIAGGDFDEDGTLDVFLGVGDDEADNFVLENDGTGTFALAADPFPPGPGRDTRAVVVAEFTGDDHVDVVLGQWFLDELLPGNGTTSFPTSVALPFATGSITDDLAAADLDADGDLDLFRASAQGSEWLRNDGFGNFVVEAVPDASAWGAEGVLLADLDGDSDLDGFLTGTRNRLLLGDGEGGFGGVPGGMPDGGYLSHLALGDANLDGRIDVFATAPPGDQVRRLFLTSPSGELEEASGVLPASAHVPSAIAVGDFDGDEAADVLYGGTGCSGGGTALFLNDGSGAFVDASAGLPTREAVTRHIALGDIDADGDLDAFVSNSTGCSAYDSFNFLYEGDGAGGFSDATPQLPSHEDNSQQAAFGDLNGDDDLDLVVANGLPTWSLGDQVNRVYANDGTGSFADVPGLLTGETRITVSVALGDVENDGDLDVLFGNASIFLGTPGIDRLYLNQDGAGFVDASGQLPPNEFRTEGVYFLDQDADGDLDILEANAEVDALWTNDGTGVFAETTDVLPDVSDFAGDVAIVDLDGDADLDLVLAGPTHVLTNLRRQLARREVPRIGQPLHLDLYTDPGSPWLLFYAFGVSAIELPPYGTFRLAPASTALVGTGVADGQGRDEAAFALPADPSLVGAQVWWQALAGATPTFTNPELTALTEL